MVSVKDMVVFQGDIRFIVSYLDFTSLQNTVKKAREMVEDLRDSFAQIIQEVDWLDAKTTRNALLKLKEMLVSMGYNEEVLDDTKLDEQYRDFNIDENMSFINMIQEHEKWRDIKTWENDLKPVDRHIPILHEFLHAAGATADPSANLIGNWSTFYRT